MVVEAEEQWRRKREQRETCGGGERVVNIFFGLEIGMECHK